MKKKVILGFLAVIVVVVILQALGIVKPEEKQTTTQPTSTMAEVETTVEKQEASLVETKESVENKVESAVDEEAVYEYLNNLLTSSENPANQLIGNENMEVNSEEWKKAVSEWQERCQEYEDKVINETAEKFEITSKEVEQIFLNKVLTESSDSADIKILHGDLLNVTNTDSNGIVINVKITSSYSNKATIDQNYFNVEDFIKNQSGNQYDSIDYWAVADMADGSEQKVVSFVVDKDTIQKIYDGQIVATQYGDYVKDLYILPSLLQ